MDTQHVANTPLNHALVSEVIFTNDEAFSEVEIEKAKMMLCVCKDAKNNKNIKKSFENAKNAKKINMYCSMLKKITEMKTRSLYEYIDQYNMRIPMSSYRKNVFKIKTKLLEENACVIEGVKQAIIKKQLHNIIECYKRLDKMRAIVEPIVSKYGIEFDIDVDGIADITDITDEVIDMCRLYDEYENYEMEDFKRYNISILFKYYAYCMNMIFNDKMTKDSEDAEEAIILYICGDFYDKNWMEHEKVPFIFE